MDYIDVNIDEEFIWFELRNHRNELFFKYKEKIYKRHYTINDKNYCYRFRFMNKKYEVNRGRIWDRINQFENKIK